MSKMLLATASACAHFPAIIIRRTPIRSHFRLSVRMTSSASSPSNPNPNPNPRQIIEHVVLFKVKTDADPSAVNAMLGKLNSLVSLDGILHLSAGPVYRSRSDINFTHMLHSRYKSKSDLISYSENPTHVGVVANYVSPVIDDAMAVDWVADDFSISPVVAPRSAMRLTLLKLKESTAESGKDEVLGVVRGIKEKFPSIEHLSVGVNFSPARAKGFSICSIAIFNGVKELEALDSDSELANEQKNKVRELLDGVVVLDYTYTVPAAAPSPSASL